MRKISGEVVCTKTTTLSRAAEIVPRFASVDNGSSAAVSLYLQRTADAFNHLVHFHDKRTKLKKLQSSPELQVNVAEKSLDGDKGKNLENKVSKKEKKTFNNLGVKGDVNKKKKKRKVDRRDT